MTRTPQQTARTIGFIMLGVIVLALVVMLVLTWAQGDPSNHLGDHRKPSQTPESTFPTATSSPS